MKNWLKDLWVKIKADLVKAHKSVTIWFNTVLGAAAVTLPLAENEFPHMQAYIPHNLYHWAMGLVVLGNIILRFKTTTALANK